MRTRFPLLASATLILTSPLSAQVIPGEAPGDLGWILYGTDTLTLVRAADGNAWLQQNLGATQVASVTNTTTAYGHLYQWGRWDDGHQLRTSATAPVTTLAVNNPSGLGSGSPLFYTGTDPVHWWSGGSGADSWMGTVSSAVQGIDPCTGLGGEWHLPSKTDWMEVLAGEGITNLATALSSNLRLPAAGSRHALTGTLINEGEFGNYWSSTTSTIYAKDLTIGAVSVTADDDGYRGYGMSCRCLNKNLHTGMREQVADRPVLFPNPTSGSFSVHSEELVLRIIVRAASGRTLASVPVNAMSSTVDLPELAAGLHTVRVETRDGVHHLTLVVAK